MATAAAFARSGPPAPPTAPPSASPADVASAIAGSKPSSARSSGLRREVGEGPEEEGASPAVSRWRERDRDFRGPILGAERALYGDDIDIERKAPPADSLSPYSAAKLPKLSVKPSRILVIVSKPVVVTNQVV